MDDSMYRVKDSRTAGEPTRFLVKGTPSLSGMNMILKTEEFKNKFEGIRRTLMQEPRGNVGILAVPAESRNLEADLGLIFAYQRGYVDMYTGNPAESLPH